VIVENIRSVFVTKMKQKCLAKDARLRTFPQPCSWRNLVKPPLRAFLAQLPDSMAEIKLKTWRNRPAHCATLKLEADLFGYAFFSFTNVRMQPQDPSSGGAEPI
jgi:hypothetical protein